MLGRFDLLLVVRNQLGPGAGGRSYVRQALVTEAVMEELARATGADPTLWGLAGLGSDIDAALTVANPDRRGLMAAELLLAEGAPPEVAAAVASFRGGRVDELPPLAAGLVAAKGLASLLAAGADVRAELEREPAELMRANEALRALGVDAPTAARLAATARERCGT